LPANKFIVMGENRKWKEGYNKIKDILKRLINPKREKALWQPALQPYRNKQRFSRG
jgi:hypothetical protein